MLLIVPASASAKSGISGSASKNETLRSRLILSPEELALAWCPSGDDGGLFVLGIVPTSAANTSPAEVVMPDTSTLGYFLSESG